MLRTSGDEGDPVSVDHFTMEVDAVLVPAMIGRDALVNPNPKNLLVLLSFWLLLVYQAVPPGLKDVVRVPYVRNKVLHVVVL